MLIPVFARFIALLEDYVLSDKRVVSLQHSIYVIERVTNNGNIVRVIRYNLNLEIYGRDEHTDRGEIWRRKRECDQVYGPAEYGIRSLPPKRVLFTNHVLKT